MRYSILFCISILLSSQIVAGQSNEQLKIAVIGLSHSHVHWILGDENDDFEIVAIVEPNHDLASRYSKQYGYRMDDVYTSNSEMLKKVRPEAVAAFGSIYEHLEVVETFAPLGIHVMVEKPLSVSLDHGLRMELLAKKHGIHLLTNYETTWYGSNHMVHNLTLDHGNLGEIRKLVIHDGHQGPVEIGINNEFLEWLTDPKLNGGGALTDFGCYGANLATWLMKDEKPISVSATTQQIKPHLYPKVDDEATIVVTYPSAQLIIQASWNWPYNRKDMEVYGKDGYAIAKNSSTVILQKTGENESREIKVKSNIHPNNNPFSYFKAVINGEISPDPYDPSSLENNMMVVKILDAAKQSAKNGCIVYLEDVDE